MAVVSQRNVNIDAWMQVGFGVYPVAGGTQAVSRVLTLRRSFDPDVLYWPMVDYWTPFINLTCRGVPVVSTLHTPLPNQGLRSRPARAVAPVAFKVVLTQSSRIVVLSNYAAVRLKQFGVSEEKVDVIPHGEMSYYRRCCADLEQVKQEKPTLLFFGRIFSYKGVEVLAEAFRIINRSMPEARLIVAGEGSPDLLRTFEGLRNVMFVNRWIPDTEVGGLLQQSDVVVVPYLKASSVSGVIPLAYAFARPVVATRVGGIAEQVIDGVTGILVPPCDPESLARACLELLFNPPRCREMGLNAYRHAISAWNWDKLAELLLSTFKRARIK